MLLSCTTTVQKYIKQMFMFSCTGQREAMRTIETVLAGGADQLMAERQDTDWGAAKEAAVLAALRLIRTAFAYDTAVVAALRHSEQSGEQHRYHHWAHQSHLRFIGG